MRQLYRKLFLLGCSLPFFASSYSQDLHFSQFSAAPLYRNPALAGLFNGDVRVQTAYRSQWNNIANAYKTTSVNAEYKMPVAGDDYLTVGMQVLHDKSGTIALSTTQLLPAINYHKSISAERNMYLSIGFMGGYVQRSIDRSKMTTTSSREAGVDGDAASLQSQYSYLDGSTGITFSSELNGNPENNLVLGVAYHHFTKPKSSFFNNTKIVVQPKTVFSADLKFALGEQCIANFHNDFVSQGTNRVLLSGALLGYKIGAYSDESNAMLRVGSFYRWGDALVPMVQLDYRSFSFGVSYDVNLSKLTAASYGRGGYELSVTYASFLDQENSSGNADRSPRF
jgi:type IX secretion system PorP/SprF family membrane protein